MKIKFNLPLFILVLLTIPFMMSKAQAQSNMTLYNMQTIPQRVYLNPARQSDAKNFLALPGISSQFISISNSTFNIDGLLSTLDQRPGDTSFINLDRFSNLFEKDNYISVQHSMDILSVGFRIRKKTYVYLTSSLNQSIRFNYPGDLFALALEGNGGDNINRTFDLGFGLDFLQYVDAGIGINRKFLDERLTLGFRYRLLKGLNVINTERNDIQFSTNPQTFDLTVRSDLKFNVASSIAQADSLKRLGESISDTAQSITASTIFNRNNMGQALDFGAEFKLTDKISISASVNNLGYIKWNTGAFNIVSNNPGASYTFEGVHIDDVFNRDSTDFSGAINQVADTLMDRMDLRETRSSFRTNLFAEVYLGGQYHLTRNHNAGILFYGSFYQKKLYPAFTLSWNSKLTRILGVSASYTAVNKSYTNLGLGMSLNLGPFQVYAVSDNIGGIFVPNEVKNLSIRTGFNLAMQRQDLEAKAEKKREKAEKKAKKAEEKRKKESEKAKEKSKNKAEKKK